MKIFVTGVNGQLGHNIMNEIAKRGYEGVGTDLASSYAGVEDNTAVTIMPYIKSKNFLYPRCLQRYNIKDIERFKKV